MAVGSCPTPPARARQGNGWDFRLWNFQHNSAYQGVEARNLPSLNAVPISEGQRLVCLALSAPSLLCRAVEGMPARMRFSLRVQEQPRTDASPVPSSVRASSTRPLSPLVASGLDLVGGACACLPRLPLWRFKGQPRHVAEKSGYFAVKRLARWGQLERVSGSPVIARESGGFLGRLRGGRLLCKGEQSAGSGGPINNSQRDDAVGRVLHVGRPPFPVDYRSSISFLYTKRWWPDE